MTTSAVEVERKYDVPPGTPVPDLTALAGVDAVEVRTDELDATYFDTEDLRLRAAGTTLRRRTGGADAGWHLKLPHGVDREEVRLDGDTSADVPPQLHALVRARTRTRPLVPVARLQTTRTVHRLAAPDGRVLAEVADDLVVGRTAADPEGELRWREWEVELVDGDRTVLDDVQAVLLAAGAAPSDSASKVGRVLGRRPTADGQPPWWGRRPPTSGKATAGGVLLAHLQGQVDELVARDPQVRRDLPDALHKMRVATRRLRSALQTFRPLLDRTATDPVRDELRWLAAVLGEVRDTEVMHARLRALVAAEPAELVVGPVLARVDTELGARYRQAHDRVLVELEGPRYLALLDSLDRLLADPPLQPPARERARTVLPGLVLHSWRRLDRDLRQAAEVTGEEQDLLLHEARKAAKRVRYAAEAVAPAYGPPAVAFAKAVTRLQEALGEHQDGVVTREALRDLAAVAHGAGEDGFTYGRLHGLEQARATAGSDWTRARRKASRGRLRHWLHPR